MALQTVVETGRQARDRIRSNQWRGVTSGVAPGYVQANQAILPKDLAFDFLPVLPAKSQALSFAGGHRARRRRAGV